MRVTSRVSLIVNILVVFIGTGIFILGYFLLQKGFIVKDTFLEAKGTVYNIIIDDSGTEVGTHLEYLQIEFYLPSGKKIQFTNEYNWENAKHVVGDLMPIYYNPDNPQEAYVADYRFLLVPGGVALLVGVIIMLFAGQYVIKNFSRKKIIAKIKQTGTKVQVPLLEIKEDLDTTIMEKHPYIISVKMNDGKIIKSDRFWNYNPEKLKPGQLVDVYFDPQKPDDYYIDVEFLNET